MCVFYFLKSYNFVSSPNQRELAISVTKIFISWLYQMMPSKGCDIEKMNSP